MNNTVAAIFDSYGDAQSAMNALFNEGFTRADVQLSPPEETTEARQQALREQAASQKEGWGIGDFFRSLFGSGQDSDDAGMYSEAVRRGGFLLSVDASTEEQADRAADVLGRFNPVDLNERAGQWRNAGWTGYQGGSPIYTAEESRNEKADYTSKTTVTGTGAAAGTQANEANEANAPAGEAIPVVEEQLQVGKRAVMRGGVRIYRHVTETPVQESVQLREEPVSVQRTPVDQPASDTSIASDEVFRQHWQSAYGSSGGKYEDYASAYRYGASLAGQKQYQGYRWDELEPQVRSDWEASNQGSPWERTRQAVRYGWEKITGH